MGMGGKGKIIYCEDVGIVGVVIVDFVVNCQCVEMELCGSVIGDVDTF
jgi:cytoskeletal protein CcmA (bactofilin family)